MRHESSPPFPLRQSQTRQTDCPFRSFAPPESQPAAQDDDGRTPRQGAQMAFQKPQEGTSAREICCRTARPSNPWMRQRPRQLVRPAQVRRQTRSEGARSDPHRHLTACSLTDRDTICSISALTASPLGMRLLRERSGSRRPAYGPWSPLLRARTPSRGFEVDESLSCRPQAPACLGAAPPRQA